MIGWACMRGWVSAYLFSSVWTTMNLSKCTDFKLEKRPNFHKNNYTSSTWSSKAWKSWLCLVDVKGWCNKKSSSGRVVVRSLDSHLEAKVILGESIKSLMYGQDTNAVRATYQHWRRYCVFTGTSLSTNNKMSLWRRICMSRGREMMGVIQEQSTVWFLQWEQFQGKLLLHMNRRADQEAGDVTAVENKRGSESRRTCSHHDRSHDSRTTIYVDTCVLAPCCFFCSLVDDWHLSEQTGV